MKKTLLIITLLAIATFGFSGCTYEDGSHTEQSAAIEENQKRLNANYEIPQLEQSLEIENNHRRLEFLNKSDSIGYVYLLSHGKVVSFYPVRGKVSSLNSYSTAMEQIVNSSGKPCANIAGCTTGYIVEAPDMDGSYGQNVEGIYFFTTEGVYVEWSGEYIYTSEALNITTQPELVRQID